LEPNISSIFEQAQDSLITLRDLMRFAVSRFRQADVFFGHGTNNAWDEAAYLLLHTLHLPIDQLEPFIDARLTGHELAECLNIIRRRIEERIPAAYLTHEAWLGEYRFYVDQRAIIPRSHIAELLEEQLSPWVEDPWAINRVLDLCTGSGCLAILAALAFPEARVDAIDISEDALSIAQRNISDYALETRIHTLKSNAFAAIPNERYDLIISNPPYVNTESMAALPPEYRQEPEIALASGEDGLDFTRIILQETVNHLNPGGLLIVEIGHNREALEAAYPDTPFTWLETAAGGNFVFLLRQKDLPGGR
jgi:protein-(glutamine-N5) methyltransferase, ribosomal protein L3-specific